MADDRPTGLRVLLPLLALIVAVVIVGILHLPGDPDDSGPAEGDPDDSGLPGDSEALGADPVPDPPEPPGPRPARPEDPLTPAAPTTATPAAGWIRGLVTNAGGEPVAGVRLAVLGPTVDWRKKVPIAAVTDERGRFSAALTSATDEVRVVSDAVDQGYVLEERLVDVAFHGGKVEMAIRLEKGLCLGGRARGPDGGPLAFADVHILEVHVEDLRLRRPVEGRVKTDEEGRFFDDGYRPGIYRVLVSGKLEGRPFGVVTEGVIAGETDLEIRFKGYGKRRITFEDELTREPLTVKFIVLELIYGHTGIDEHYIPWAEFRNRREVVFDHLPEGHYRLRLVHPGYEEVFTDLFFVQAGKDAGEICYRLIPE